MQQITTKTAGVTFTHREDLKGEVLIQRGEHSVSVPIAALRAIVAESVRADLIDQAQKMKPDALLRRATA